MTKKRINGEGNIRKRSEHSWEASLRTEGGVRLYVYGSSQKEVKEKLQAIQAEIANGTYVAENEMTVGDWMDEWYECFTSGVKESSRARYAQDIRNHIRPGIGSIHLQDLSLSHVQRFLNQCKEKKHLALKSVKNIYLILNKALNKAQKSGIDPAESMHGSRDSVLRFAAERNASAEGRRGRGVSETDFRPSG